MPPGARSPPRPSAPLPSIAAPFTEDSCEAARYDTITSEDVCSEATIALGAKYPLLGDDTYAGSGTWSSDPYDCGLRPQLYNSWTYLCNTDSSCQGSCVNASGSVDSKGCLCSSSPPTLPANGTLPAVTLYATNQEELFNKISRTGNAVMSTGDEVVISEGVNRCGTCETDYNSFLKCSGLMAYLARYDV